MTRLLSTTWVRVALAIAVLAGGLGVLQPWTVRPLQTPPPVFDAAAYAELAWARLLQEVPRTAADLRTAVAEQRAAPSRRSVFVTVTGTVIAIDRESRVGVVRLRVEAPAPAVAIQVGPVFRGTAVRDAAEFIRFGDFTNQSEFAAVSNALHDRVRSEVVGRIDLDALPGKTITVLGAMTLPAAGTVELVPVHITIPGGSQ
jgi:predicted lipoprotein